MSERSRPLDASMTLLREVMERPLDPGYAAAAAHPRPSTRRRTAITLVLAILAGAGFAVAVGSIRVPQRESDAVSQELREEIQRRTEDVNGQQRRNAELAAANAAAQETLLGSRGAALSRQVQELGALTGEIAVSGKGVQVTLDDAPGRDQVGGDPREDVGFDEGVVLDADVQVVVNGLWAAGAEAISINGERLTAVSAIRSAGEAILVDFRPLVPPYVISVIGDPGALQSRFAEGQAGPYVQSLRDNNGIRADIAAADELVLPGAGQFALRAARPVEEEAKQDAVGKTADSGGRT
ncbi:DUF881 domain-containing protein [Kineosporia rhizophila]|uniref:DUF881 domain-containing protein n=1 Tax=Kineosporia TaxID=49184 RepID=UPI001E56C006|nr:MULTISPECIES: DUF881 domain-containing protein [Kineosporia]MCE0539484.1 DUF881 domain-containing protein [Kineosporia rhizophila]GLY18485.1 membrane protein [Kineosporia sp. NBRC 101677]